MHSTKVASKSRMSHLNKFSVGDAYNWSFMRSLARLFFSLIVPIILARILSPNEFGLMAMSAVFIGIGSLISDLGTGDALIQRQSRSQALESTIFWLNLTIATIFAAILFATASVISGVYNNTIVGDIIQFMSIMFLFQSLSIVQVSLMKKKKDFKSIAIAEVFSQVISSIFAITLALNDFGVWSLVAFALTKSLLYVLAIWFFSDWMPSWVFKYNELKNVINFSINLTYVKFLNYIERNADKFIVGFYQGANVLGVYSRSYSTFSSSMKFINGFYNPVFYSVIVEAQNDRDKLKKALLESYQLLLFIFIPISLIFIFLSNELVLTIFGEQWIEMAPMLPIFGYILLFKPLNKLNVEMFKAVSKVNIMSNIWSFFTPLFVIGFLIGNEFYGSLGVVYAYLFVSLLLFFTTSRSIFKLLKITKKNVINKFTNHIARGFLVAACMILYKYSFTYHIDNVYVGFVFMGNVIIILLFYYLLQIFLPIATQNWAYCELKQRLQK